MTERERTRMALTRLIDPRVSVRRAWPASRAERAIRGRKARMTTARAIGSSPQPLLCLLAIILSSATVHAQPLDVDRSGPPVDPFTDLVYVARRLLNQPPVPPSFRVLDPGIDSDVEIAARIDALGAALDVDADGTVDVFTDVVYCARDLFAVSPVPPSFRLLDPGIPDDALIADRCRALGGMTPTPTPTRTAVAPTASASPTPSQTTSTVSPTRVPTVSASPTPSATATLSAIPTATVGGGRPCGAIVLPASTSFPISASTVGESDDVQEAPCGSGGGFQAPDIVYEYIAPVAGRYDLTVDGNVMGVRFTPLVQLFFGDCQASRSICRDDGGVIQDPLDPRHNQIDPLDGKVTYATERVEVGQRLAISVDGSNPMGGTFTLDLRRRQPDLALSPPEILPSASASVGSVISVSVLVENIGTIDSEETTLTVGLYKDPALSVLIGASSSDCAIPSLAKDATGACHLDLPVPFVAPGAYFVGARVETDDRDPSNNVSVGPFGVVAPGLVFEQHAFRANDGTVYQALIAQPSTSPTRPGAFQVTTVALSEGGLTECLSTGSLPGEVLRAAVGASSPMPTRGLFRTRAFAPNDLNPALLLGDSVFDAKDGGRLRIGSGDGAIEICSRSSTCDRGEVLTPIDSAGGGVPAACELSVAAPGLCPTGAAFNSLAFGLPIDGDTCAGAAQPVVTTSVCGPAAGNGLVLTPGEALVLVWSPSREGVDVGSTALGVALADEGGPGGCAKGQFVSAARHLDRLDQSPILSLQNVQFGEDLVGNGTRLAFDPDGLHAYIVNGQTLTTTSRAPSGELMPIQVLRDGDLGIDGLEDARDVVVSPDGSHVYVAGAVDAVLVFQRQASPGTAGFGTLHFRQTLRNGVAGVLHLDNPTSVDVSPDGAHVYVKENRSADVDSIAIFRRQADPDQGNFGNLTYQDAIFGGAQNGGVPELKGPSDLVFTPDADQLYVVDAVDGSLLLFDRTTDTLSPSFGALNFRRRASGFFSPIRAATTSDGRHLYATSLSNDSLTVLRRNTEVGPEYGSLTLRQTLTDGDSAAGLDGALGVVLSENGEQVYVAGRDDDDIAIFSRDADVSSETEGTLTFRRTFSLDSPRDLALPRDGRHLYVTNADRVTALNRDLQDGSLTMGPVLATTNPFFRPTDLVLSPDGHHLYFLASQALIALTRTKNDPLADTFGNLRHLQTLSALADDLPLLLEADSITSSIDGAHIYVTSLGFQGVGVFERSTGPDAGDFGRLTFQEGLSHGLDDDSTGDLAVSQDDAHLYVLSDSGLVAMTRDAEPSSANFGRVAVFQVIPEVGHISLAPRIVLSRDGAHAYVTASDSITTLERNSDPASADFGRLAVLESIENADDLPPDVLVSTRDLAISNDGSNVYVLSSSGLGTGNLAVFVRDQDGRLRFEQVIREGVDVPQGLRHPHSVAVSSDGSFVIVAGAGPNLIDGEVTVLRRHIDEGMNGRLSIVDVLRGGEPGVVGIGGAVGVALSCDGPSNGLMHVYVSGNVADAIAGFRVNN
jgi:DNA-binding beta-propeller fold protein YncE